MANLLLLVGALGLLTNVSATGTSMSVALEKRVAKSMSGGLATHKMAYFGTVKLGSPSQEFTVVFDTGSGNLIVPLDICRSEACEKHRVFEPDRSDSLTPIMCDGTAVEGRHSPDKISITFGTGKITGDCFTDKICVSNVCTNGNFIAATAETAQPFASFSFDGVLGLAPDIMAQADEFSVMNRLSSSGALKKPMFAIFMSASNSETSEITFGDLKEEHMASELFWVPIAKQSGYWQVSIEDIYFDDKPTGLCVGCNVAVDSGTSELAGPTETIRKMQSMLQEDCHHMPKIGFAVNGRILSLDPKDYSSRSCSLSLMSLDVPPPKGPLFVLGIPFLTKYYTVYDHENSRVGFAVAKHAGQVAESLLTVNGAAVHKHRRTESFLAASHREAEAL